MRKGYTEPKSLVERTDLLVSGPHIVTIAAVLIVLAVGIYAAVSMNQLSPTFNGNVDVAALQEDETAYDLEGADGAAYVIVAENREKTAAENVTFSVVFNFRGYDTMGESFVLIAALSGALCILMPKKEKGSKEAEKTDAIEAIEAAVEEAPEPEAHQKEARSIIVRYASNLFLPLACTFGGYVVLHGDTSPGGGFQGGVLIAAAVLLVYLAYGGKALGRVFRSNFLHETETIAEIIYIAVGLIGVLVGLNFAVNFVIDNLHIETALLMNHAVGYHVMAGVGCLLIMLLGMITVEKGDDAVEDPDMADVELDEEEDK